MVITGLLSLGAGVALGVAIFLIYRKLIDDKTIQSAEKEAERIINRARSQATKIERDSQVKAKDFEARARKNLENDIRKEKQRVQSLESQLRDKEQRLEREIKRKQEQTQTKLRELDEEAQRLVEQQKRLKETEDRLQGSILDLEKKLQDVAQLSSDQAKTELKSALLDDAKKEIAGELKKIEESAEREAQRKARRILSAAVARYASEVATERTVTSIPLTGEEMKGKIIGREGRNIRALEAACGVDLIIDETPETVIISSFDPVRREVARRSLERLMEDGRVHPARIEEVVDKVKSEMTTTLRVDGEKACFEAEVHNVHPAVQNLLGGLKYRQGEGQNLLAQSLEVSSLAGLMAAEIGFDISLARRAGLLHAIGRALDHTFEGSYAQVGGEFARKHGEKEEVVHAIMAHNEDIPLESTLDHIVQAAFNLSRSRPGAKKGNMDAFVRRLSDLESVANSFDGVARSYAIQSGKEIRVIVDSSKVTDEQSLMLVRDIAKKIERELNYSGQIRVAVVRETRMVEHAR